MNEITERIARLRRLMETYHMDAYLVPTADFHESEYVGEHFACRKYITGFTGSAGIALITKDWAGLWTDGRYFVQASAELKDSGVELMKMGQPGVPTVEQYLADHMPEQGVLGFDGRVINSKTGESLQERLSRKQASICSEHDLIGEIWENRPELAAEPVWILEEKYAGQAAAEKIKNLREAMKKAYADVHIITTLDDIVWLFNIRGNDIPCNPVVLSYLMVTGENLFFYVNPQVISDEVRAYLESLGVSIRPYNDIYADVKELKDHTVLLEKSRVNFAIYESVQAQNQIIDQMNPTVYAKTQKNATEIENMKKAHIIDGVVMTKYIYWLKKNIGKIPMTEISASDYLEARRREQDNFIELSFDTICAYGPNAAMMHYAATPESDAELKPEGFLLVDSGGHYFEGTTDITRTMALGPITDEMRLHFTTVCRSNMNLANAKFLYGCTGLNLDILSRGPLWQMGIDYKCGTGHGVGYILNVHEGPNGFRWRVVPERHDNGTLEEGMVTTDEPGVYLEGKYGIRTENELVCHKAEKNEYGQFMNFENITYAPIDLDAIDPDEMTGREKKMLNDYHAMVYKTLSPYMTPEENEWLKKYTRAI